MIVIKDKTEKDYENAGNLYCIEISTDRAIEYDLIKYYIQLLEQEAQ